MRPMKKSPKSRCASCRDMECYDGKDCFELSDLHRSMYQDPYISQLHRAATAIEGRHYCQEPRISEIMLFAREMNFKRLGLAFCIGLSEEARVIEKILSREFKVISVCCKVSGIAKGDYHLEQIRPGKPTEVMCNPAGQAQILNDAKTDLNVICGLCVGHDAIFTMQSKAPVTTLITKDRVLGHNPAAALYVRYIRRNLLPDEGA